jgi:hypothetical protein
MYENHPEIFFSQKDLKNINIHNLIRNGKFGKVFIYYYKKKKIFFIFFNHMF